MVYGCGNKCVKYSVFTVNFLVFVVGAVILGVSLGVLFSSAAQKYIEDAATKGSKEGETISVNEMYIPLYVLAGIGGFLMLTGFFGCCGACCENTIMLGAFFTIILVLFIAELGCGIAVLVKKESVRTGIVYKAINNTVKEYNNDPASVKDFLVSLQKEFRCCGCASVADYRKLPPPEPCDKEPALPGCCPKIWDDINSKLNMIGIAALVVLVIEILAMVFSCILCRAVNRGEYQHA